MYDSRQIDPLERGILARQLAPTIAHLSKRYTQGLSPAPQIPSTLRTGFYTSMTGFDRSMADVLSRQVVELFEQTEDPNKAIEEVGTEFQGQMGRLSHILRQRDQQFRGYLALKERPEYPFYVFLSEQSLGSCERCMEKHGRLFRLEDLGAQAALPPLHFGCRCRLVAMDSRMAAVYAHNRERVLSQLEDALDELSGQTSGFFRLTHGAWLQGISAHTLQPIELPPRPAVTDGIHSSPAWYEGLKQWAREFGTDALDFLDALLQRGRQLFVHADETIQENPLLGLLCWADALAVGIPSAVWESFVQRWTQMKETPEPYAVLDFFTLGLCEIVEGAVAPEEPWSFQHFMDMLGLVTVLYGAARGIKRTHAHGVEDALYATAWETGKVRKIRSADRINDDYLKLNPTHEPPYWPGTQVYEIQLTQQTQFVRVYGGKSSKSGQWVMRAEEIEGLTAAQIQDKFSLPQIPTHICDATLPADTLLEMSTASAVMGGGGGGVQIRIAGQSCRTWFSNERSLNTYGG